MIIVIEPCRFCPADKAEHGVLDDSTGGPYQKSVHWYYCPECGARGPRAGNKADALALWNKKLV